jgi:hypothetical protein
MASSVYAQDEKAIKPEYMLLKDISASIATYKDKTMTLRLKLKMMDRVFNKIVFYDRKNIDIEFDVTKTAEKRFASSMLNLHEGMEYFVTFKVLDAGSLGMVIAELISFEPVIMGKLPEGGGEKKVEKAE